MVIQKFSRTMLFHDLIDHLGYLRRYICFTSSLLSMLSTGTAEARSRVPLRLRAWGRMPVYGRRHGLAGLEKAGPDCHQCRSSCDRRWVISSQIHLYIGASIWHPLMENGRSLFKKSATFFLRD
jgi:hypothetical protein